MSAALFQPDSHVPGFDGWRDAEEQASAVIRERKSHLDERSRVATDRAIDRQNEIRGDARKLLEDDDLGRRIKKCAIALEELEWRLRVPFGDYSGTWDHFLRVAVKDGMANALKRIERWPWTFRGTALGLVFRRDQIAESNLWETMATVRRAVDGTWEELRGRLLAGPAAHAIVNAEHVLFALVRRGVLPDEENRFQQALKQSSVQHSFLFRSNADRVAAFAREDARQISDRFQKATDDARRAEEWETDRRTFPGWIGVGNHDFRRIRWLTELDELRDRIGAARSNGRQAADERTIAQATYNRVRRNVYGNLPSPDRLIKAAREIARELYRDVFDHRLPSGR